MKVLLVKDVDTLGWFGDVVEVREGYARNYLLPYGLAEVANARNVEAVAEEKTKRSEARADCRKKLQIAAAAAEGAEAVVASKVNEQGHLFGSITAAHIAENLRQQHLLPPKPSASSGARHSAVVFEDGVLKVSDEVVQISEPIRQVGTYTDVKVRFAEDLTASITVVVAAEQQAEDTQPQQQ